MWSFVKNLKGSGIGIANDFPKQIDEIHQKLYPVFKEAKRTGQKASFKVDKLIISGQVYRAGLYTNINKNMDATAKIESFLRNLNIP